MQKILVIDDDAPFRTRMRTALCTKGYDLIEAESATDGISLARSQRPDLIISDVYLEDGDGYALLERLRNDPTTASVPLILMTGHDSLEGMRRGMELGADDYLPKPFTPEALFAAIEARFKKERVSRQQAGRTEARLVAILQATTDLVGILDVRSQSILYLNPAGRRMMGIGDEEDVSHVSLADFYPAWALELIRHEGIPAAERNGVWTGETAFLNRSGDEILVSQMILAHKAPDGSLEFVSTIARDISERKRAEAERSQMEIQLRHAQKLESIGQLAAGIAHEINTPTQYIGDNTRFLEDAFVDINKVLAQYDKLLQAAKVNALSPELITEVEGTVRNADVPYLMEEMPKAIQQSLEGVGRVAKIVRAMKEFSHPGTSEKTPTDLNHVIESTLTVSRNEWKYVAEMVTDFDLKLTPVPCLPGEFSQVILNLVVNAARAIADVVGDGGNGKGTIKVTTRRCGDRAEIRTSDTGTGIPEKARAKIFDPFFTTKAVGKGTGQGLAIARSVVVDKHGGTIAFETETGKGTTFIITLPLRAKEETSK